MDKRADGFRSAVSKANGRGSIRRQFSPGLRAQAVDYVESQRAAGVTWSTISEDLGVGVSLLRKWCAAAPPRFARVELEEDESAAAEESDVRLRTPSGFEVSGLSVDQAVELLRRLR